MRYKTLEAAVEHAKRTVNYIDAITGERNKYIYVYLDGKQYALGRQYHGALCAVVYPDKTVRYIND